MELGGTKIGTIHIIVVDFLGFQPKRAVGWNRDL